MDNILILSDDGKTIKGVNDNVVHLIVPDGVTNIGSNAFKNCTFLQSIVIPNSVISIESCAFHGCTSLISIEIPDSVINIEEYAFQGCKSLKNVIIPDSVEFIGEDSFNETLWYDLQPDGAIYINNVLYNIKGNPQEETFHVKDGIKRISPYAFVNCEALRSISIPKSVTHIGHGAFYDLKSLECVEMPDSMISINDGEVFDDSCTFENCEALMSISIPKGITTITKCIFRDCKSLQSVDIPNSVTTIGSGAFVGCESLQSIDIPNSVTTIGSGAFQGCKSLQSVDIPNSVTTIECGAFCNCISLQSIDFPDNLLSIGASAFNHTGLKVVNIPKTVKKIGNHAFCNTPIETILVEEGNALYMSIDGVLLGINNKKDGGATFRLIKYPPKKDLISYTVGTQVTSLDCCAFKGASKLQEIVLHDNIGDFGDQQTFAMCSSLKEIYIPPKVNRLPSSCFNGCEALESVYVCDRETLQIKMKSFEKCTSLKNLHFQMCNPENITVEIGAFDKDVFNKCVLFIPSGTRWAYRHHPVLGKFKNIEIEK